LLPLKAIVFSFDGLLGVFEALEVAKILNFFCLCRFTARIYYNFVLFKLNELVIGAEEPL